MEKRYSINSPKMTRKYYPNAQKFVVSHKDWKEKISAKAKSDFICGEFEMEIVVVESIVFAFQ